MEVYLGATVVLLVLLGAFSIVWSTVKTGISPMPSSRKARHAILKLIQSTDSGPVLELGAGWGGLAVDIARHNPERLVIGYEQSMLPYVFSTLRQRIIGPANLRFHRQDFFQVQLQEAGVLVCYLYPGAMERLAEVIDSMGPDRPTIISNTFRLPGFSADHTQQLNDIHGSYIYRYDRPTEST